MSSQQDLKFEQELRKLAGEVCRDGLPVSASPRSDDGAGGRRSR